MTRSLLFFHLGCLVLVIVMCGQSSALYKNLNEYCQRKGYLAACKVIAYKEKLAAMCAHLLCASRTAKLKGAMPKGIAIGRAPSGLVFDNDNSKICVAGQSKKAESAKNWPRIVRDTTNESNCWLDKETKKLLKKFKNA